MENTSKKMDNFMEGEVAGCSRLSRGSEFEPGELYIRSHPASFIFGRIANKPQVKAALLFIIITLTHFAINDGRTLLFHK